MIPKNTLVIGASLNPIRYSYRAVQTLRSHQVPTRAIGLKEGMISDVSIDTKAKEYTGIHTVTLYLNPLRQKAYYDYIISLRPQRVIFNPGTENPEFMQLLDSYNISYEIACTLVLLATRQF